MAIKQNIPPHIESIISQLDEQIFYHEQAIYDLKKTRQMWLEHQPEPQRIMKINSPLTRELIRSLVKSYGQPLQTVKMIDLLYKGQTEDERTKLIKTLSVMLNQMTKEGEIITERKEGVKGNFYRWKK